MATTRITEDDRFGWVASTVVNFLISVRGSFIYFVWTSGILMLLTGAILDEGVMAAMLTIWGASAIVYGVLGYFGLRLIGYSQ